MTSILRVLAMVAFLAIFALPASAEEAKTAAQPAIYAPATQAVTVQPVAWPGYYYYGVYYGSYRWRYQPYYTYYAPPWYGGYSFPSTGYAVLPGAVYGPVGYYGTWPYYGAYGYTYYGPVVSGYYGYGY